MPESSFAVIETTTSLQQLQQVLATQRGPAVCQLRLCEVSPQGYSWFNLCIDDSDALQAFTTARNVLQVLLDAADRGLVQHFRIVSGADLLRTQLPSACDHGNAGGTQCRA